MFRLTSAIGDFIFVKNTQLSHAKLVRDTVQGQILNPKPGETKLKSSYQIRQWIWDNFSKSMDNIQFVVKLKDV